MSEVIEFAKILRRAFQAEADKHGIIKWGVQVALDAAIAEFESTPRIYTNCVLYAPCGHAAKVRRDEEEGVLHVDAPCPKCESTRGREYPPGIVAGETGSAGGWNR
jgi:hypothetical protein